MSRRSKTAPEIPGLRIVQVRHRGVAPDYPGEHHFLQISTLDALMDRRFDGDVTIGELAAHGDHGIGTFDGLDGELILIDGNFFQISVDGRAHLVSPDRKTPFALVTWFSANAYAHLVGSHDRLAIETTIGSLVGSDESVAVRIDGTFSPLRARSAIPENKPYRPLPAAVEANQEVFIFEEMQGTMVGFRFPEAAAGVQIPGYHLHAISADRTMGGHVLDYQAHDVTIAIQRVAVLQIELPRGVKPGHLGLAKEDLAAVQSIEG